MENSITVTTHELGLVSCIKKHYPPHAESLRSHFKLSHSSASSAGCLSQQRYKRVCFNCLHGKRAHAVLKSVTQFVNVSLTQCHSVKSLQYLLWQMSSHYWPLNLSRPARKRHKPCVAPSWRKTMEKIRWPRGAKRGGARRTDWQ